MYVIIVRIHFALKMVQQSPLIIALNIYIHFLLHFADPLSYANNLLNPLLHTLLKKEKEKEKKINMMTLNYYLIFSLCRLQKEISLHRY